MSKASPSDVAKQAYQIWEREGRPHGRDQEHWYTAEREVLGAKTAQEDRPIGEIRSAQEASSRPTGAAETGKATKPAAPPPLQAAAATTGRTPQVQGSQTAAKSTPSQAGQPSAPQTQQSAQQPASGKGEPPRGAKPQSPQKRKSRTGGKQSNP